MSVAALMVATTGYGLWQVWWLAVVWIAAGLGTLFQDQQAAFDEHLHRRP